MQATDMIFDAFDAFLETVRRPGALLAIDYGEKRMGLAVADPLWMVATPLEVYQRQNNRKDLGYLARIIREKEITGLVMGWPLEEDGSQGQGCERVLQFAQKLAGKTTLPVFLQDERYTTAAVTSAMKEHQVKRAKRHAVDDKLAASYLLQMVLDKK